MWLAVSLHAPAAELIAACNDASSAVTDLAPFGERTAPAVGDATAMVLGTMRAAAHRLPSSEVCAMVHELINEGSVTPGAAISAIHCLVASRATDDGYGAGLAADLIRKHAHSVDAPVLVPALRAIVGGDGAEHADLPSLAVALIEAGRRPEVERAAPDLTGPSFGEPGSRPVQPMPQSHPHRHARGCVE
ncbi:hypothetical protein Vqi01_58000 [Micromonospora qiuiae]|uniref:DUF222 domain-containing protein n=2 Tax=Micromonospora qiuiae TaxID=502268 RepID=A0ABQ4JJ63_9ACTN|nr:hypothetical protein Vqi01_58000 [Micromonospora qiuiae]